MFFNRQLTAPIVPAATPRMQPPAPAPLRTLALPDATLSMSDHIRKAARQTGPFEYVSLSSSTLETKQSRLTALLSRRPNWRVIRGDLPAASPMTCVDRVITLRLADAIPDKFLAATTAWIALERLTLGFTSAQSVYSAYSTIAVQLYDERLNTNEAVRSVIAPNNFGFDCEMSMDNCVHVKDIPLIKLRVEMRNSIFDEGVAWGTLIVGVEISESAVARQLSAQDTIAVLRVPDSALRSRKTNPNHVDLCVDQDDVDNLAAMYKKGRIIDHTKSVTKQVRAKYSASEAGSDSGRQAAVASWAAGTSTPARSALRTRSPPAHAASEAEDEYEESHTDSRSLASDRPASVVGPHTNVVTFED